MSIIIKNISSYAAILLTGLSAGFFYAWAVSVIPGTKQISDKSYLEAMQSINRAIMNPGFFAIFIGSLLLLVIACVIQYSNDTKAFIFIVLATICYLFGTVGVTGVGNVPMNEALDAINLNNLDAKGMKNVRLTYESKWNMLHNIRTLFSVLAFVFSLLSVFVQIKK